MVKRYLLAHNKIVETNIDDCPVLVFISPDDGEKQMLVEKFKIDEHTLQSALDPNELSWLEVEPNHLAVIFKRPKNYSAKDQLLFKPTTVGVFAFRRRIIIVLGENLNLFEGKLFNRVASLKQLLLKLIYRSIFHFLEHLKVINMITAELETKVNRSMENRYLINLFTLEKSLVYYMDAINANGVLLERLKHNAGKIGFADDENELIEDIVIENNQCAKQAEIYSSILASLMDARASIVSNNLNILIKILNIITIALMVPTLIVSIFSMNVGLPMQSLPHAFWLILGLAGVSMAIVLVIWRALRI